MSCTQRRPNWTGTWLRASNESAPFWWMLVTACRCGNGPPIFANIFFPVVRRGFFCFVFFISHFLTVFLQQNPLRVLLVTLSVLEKKASFYFRKLICVATRERFFFHLFLGWRFQCLTYLSHLPGTLWRTSSCQQQQQGGSSSDLTVSLCSVSRFRTDAL